MKHEDKLLLLQCLIASAPVLFFACATTTFSSTDYTTIDAYLCVASEFIETHSEVDSVLRCALLCSDNPRCQAFRAPEGGSAPCQLFLFDACSRSVRSDCGCSQRGRLFVKQRSGLPSGSLCPSDFDHGRCGVKYRVYNGTGSWEQSRLRCESEPGLVIMADAIDPAELSHLDQVRNEALTPQSSVWLGGLQQPGSPEPSGGWMWASCGVPVASDLWASSQPDNYAGDNSIAIYNTRPGLTDMLASDSRATAVMCECVSPFD